MTGVHVSRVWSLLQDEVVADGAIGVAGLMNSTEVNEVSIAALNVKTIGALDETPAVPLAGRADTRVGWARVDAESPIAPRKSSPFTAIRSRHKKPSFLVVFMVLPSLLLDYKALWPSLHSASRRRPNAVQLAALEASGFPERFLIRTSPCTARARNQRARFPP